MDDVSKTREQLIEELASLRERVEQLRALEIRQKQVEETLRLNEARSLALVKLNQLSTGSFRDMMNATLEEAVRLTGSKIGYFAFVNEDETVLTMYSWSRSAMEECAVLDKPIAYAVKDTGLWGEAVRQRRPIITNDYSAPNPLKKGTPAGHVHLIRHMNVPVFDGEHIVLVAGVGNKPSDYDETDAQQLTLLMSDMWGALQRRRAEEEQGQLQQQIIEAQRQAIQELSTPIIPIMDRIIVMPLVGSIDTLRARDITRALLRGISEYRAKVVIVDITGVPLVDTGVANHLDKTIQAARLKGARTIITGVSDAVAETIVDLGIDWGGVETLRDLQSGLLAALNNLGIKLSK